MKRTTLWYTLGGVFLLGILLFFLLRSPNASDTGPAWTKGPASAKITLVEFADLECPACAAYHPILRQLHDEFPNDLRIEFRHFPLLQIHRYAMLAAQAAEAAGKQGKFWEMHDLLYVRQDSWSNANNVEELFVSYAKELGINTEQFQQDLHARDVKQRVTSGIAEGRKLKVTGTPTFFLNGTIIQNPGSYEAFRSIINQTLGSGGATVAPDQAETEYVHEHADLLVMINGKALDLSQAKYQSSDTKVRDQYVHLHNGKGNVIHKHKKGVTLGAFFKTLGITFTSQCLNLDTGESYCVNDTQRLTLFVNGQERTEYDAYEFKDLDKIFISYGPNDATRQGELNSITNDACIYSETCPERGPAPKEACVGGLGTHCAESHPHAS